MDKTTLQVIIQGWWNAEVKSLESQLDIIPEEWIDKGGKIDVCDVIVKYKGKTLHGVLEFDGKKLRLISSKDERQKG